MKSNCMTWKVALFSLCLLSRLSVSAEMRGHLVYGHEVREFQPCNEERSYWLVLPSEWKNWMELAYQRLVTQPYEPVYAELDAQPADAQPRGFAETYDGVIEVRKIHLLTNSDSAPCRSERPPQTPTIESTGKTRAQSRDRTFVFVCDQNTSMTVRASENVAWVFRSEGTLQLPRVEMEAAEKYSDGAFELWIADEKGMMGKTGGEMRTCRNDRRRAVWEHAKLGGVDFRAVGNEPGWHLEILQRDLVVLVADYGMLRLALPLPSPRTDHASGTTRWEAGELSIEVNARPCNDSMSGEQFESTVRVHWGERRLEGCGRALH